MSTASPVAMVASGQSSGPFRVDEMTVVGRALIWETQGSRTPDSTVLVVSICTNCRKVLAPRTIRCSSSYMMDRCASSSGPYLPQ